ncbi:3'-5' exonuclease [Alteromonadaceae bacterium BrNp21-10]|nr:3'-5' exonuclease [Alteromonadaceae bacterium BrNp21-10]
MWRRLLKKCFPASHLPSQWRDKSWFDLPFIAIDLELTGLDHQQVDILSIGWVTAQHCCIDLDQSVYQVISSKKSLEQSPVIHGLTADDISKGQHLLPIIEKLLSFANTHIWVFHHAHLDVNVLKRVCRNLGLPWPPIVTLDTMQMALYSLNRSYQVLPPNSATLPVVRASHGLAAAPAHNALDDAMATMELLFAQMQQADPKNELLLQDFYHTGALRQFSEN